MFVDVYWKRIQLVMDFFNWKIRKPTQDIHFVFLWILNPTSVESIENSHPIADNKERIDSLARWKKSFPITFCIVDFCWLYIFELNDDGWMTETEKRRDVSRRISQSLSIEVADGNRRWHHRCLMMRRNRKEKQKNFLFT